MTAFWKPRRQRPTFSKPAGGGASPVIINGGDVAINVSNVGYGKLIVTAQTLTFNGTLTVSIDASNQANKDYLYVSKGAINLQNNSTLYVIVNNSAKLQPKMKWIIIGVTNGPINKFVMPMTTVPGGLGLTDGVNTINDEQYVVSS